jgi:hypothetical protein
MRQDGAVAVGLVGVAAAALILIHPISSPGIYILPAGFLLVAPGWASVVALFPHTGMERGERIAYTGGFALAIATFTGLILDLVPGGLERNSWACGMAVATLATSTTAHFRGGASWGVPRLPLLRGSACIGAVAIAGAGLIYSHGRAESHDANTRFTQVWAQPVRQGDQVTGVSFGVTNHEGRPERYVLIGRTASDRTIFRRGPFSLAPGQSHVGAYAIQANSTPFITLAAFSAADSSRRYGYTKIWLTG